MFNSALYQHSPRRVQEWILSGRSYARAFAREGATFRRLSKEIDASQWLDPAALAGYERARMRQTLVNASAEVPFYQESMADLGVDARVAQLPSDLSRLPILTKDDVRNAGNRLVSSASHGPCLTSNTSGTTGSPLKLHQNLSTVNREHAFIWRQLTWAGMRPGDRRAWIRGDMIVPASVTTGPFWRENAADKMLMMSSFHLSEANGRGYIEALETYNPTIIQAYPSSVTFLAAWMENNSIHYKGRALRGIVTSSETMSLDAKKLVSRVFGCMVYDWYGQAERVAAIGTCEHGNYHVMSDYGYTELLPVGNDLFEIVGTTYSNFTMPLIRYRCGDLVRRSKQAGHCACGRHFPLVEEVIGRADDAVKLPDGRRVSACLAGNVFRGIHGILQGQIRQLSKESLDIFVVATKDYSPESADKLRGNIKLRIGDAMKINIHCVEELERTPRGKFKAVVCEI